MNGVSNVRKGRPRKPVPEELREHLCPGQSVVLYSSSDQYAAWRAGCGRATHCLYRQVNAVCKQYMAFVNASISDTHERHAFRMPCIYCGIGSVSMSAVQVRVTAVIESIWPSTPLYFDVCMADTPVKSSFDTIVGMPGPGCIGIMVDGPGHFKGLHSTHADRQRIIDRRMDMTAYACGFNVVRLHHENSYDEWRSTLMRAAELAHKHASFILYSPFYEGSEGLTSHVGVSVDVLQHQYNAIIAKLAEQAPPMSPRQRAKRARKGYV